MGWHGVACSAAGSWERHQPPHNSTPTPTPPVQAKAGAGSATLSMAAAAARFCAACLRAMGGQPGVVECAYVASSLTDLPYLASQLRLGPAGIEGGWVGAVGGWAGAASRGQLQEQSGRVRAHKRCTRAPCHCGLCHCGCYSHPLFPPCVNCRPPAPPPCAEFLPLPRLNALERENFEAMKEELRGSIDKGVRFAQQAAAQPQGK